MILGESSITPDLQSDHIYLRRKSTYRWLLLRDFLFCLSWWASAQFLTSSSGNLGVLLPERDFRCRDTDGVCSLIAFTTTGFLSYVSCSLTVFLPTCTRNMPRAWIYLGILLFLFAVNLSTQGEWRISVIATPHIYT